MLCNIGNRRLKCFGCTEFFINLCLFQAYEIMMRWRSCKWILYFLRNNLYCLLKFLKSKHISVKFAALTKISTVWKTKKPKFRSLDFKYDFMYRCKKKKNYILQKFRERIFFSTFTIYNIGELLMLCNLLNLSIYGPFHFPSNNFQITKKNCLWVEGVGKMLIEQNEKRKIIISALYHLHMYTNIWIWFCLSGVKKCFWLVHKLWSDCWPSVDWWPGRGKKWD